LDKKTYIIYKLIRKLCAVNILFKTKYGTYYGFDTVSDHGGLNRINYLAISHTSGVFRG